MALDYYFLITVVLFLLTTLIARLALKSKLKNINHIFYKVLSLVLAGVFFVRYLYGGKIPLYHIVNLTQNSPFSNGASSVLSLILVWSSIASILLICLHSFFKIKNITNLIKTFSLITALLNLFFFSTYYKGLLAGDFSSITFQGVLIAVEIAIMLTYSNLIVINTGFFKFSKKELLTMALTFILVMLANFPVYTLQLLFGSGNASIKLEELSFHHRIILYLSLLMPLAIWLMFRNKKQEEKRFAILYLSISTMTIFLINYSFATLKNPLAWPLHLCNTAMFIMPITLIFKSNKVFYFTYYINVLGAFLAMAMPNYKGVTLHSPTFWVFYVNHYIAFFLPFLIVALGEYKKPKRKEFKYSMIAFTVYFVLILFINAWFSNYGNVDFFFLNSDFIVTKLGKWAENTRLFQVDFNIGTFNFKFYPLYQLLFYLVYVAAAFGVWFVYEQSYTLADTLKDMSAKNKILKANKQIHFNNKKDLQNMNDLSNKVNVSVKGATKRYAKSNVYAIKDVNLEVNGGEIFGFLGPNGSGKSTLIKSIVGIQTLTEGHISICGHDIEKDSIKAKSQIGFVPDHYALYEKLTAREYVNYIADLYNVPQKERDERIELYTKSLNIEKAFDNKMNTFSHGMKQKITIISALVHNPKLLILDEPLTGLDPNTIFQVKEVMKNHAKEGNIVFFSSHIIDIVEKLCTKIAIIKNGKLVKEVSLKELENQKINLEKFYLETIEEFDHENETVK